MRRILSAVIAVILAGMLCVPAAARAVSSPLLTRSVRFDLFSFLQWDMRMIRMPPVWESGPTGAGVRVGIIDSGISNKTRDLDPERILPGINFLSENGDPSDTTGHGTFIAGIIGASRHNGYGISGIAPDATLIPMKTSENRRSEVHPVADAIRSCAEDYQCDVINLSFGTEEDLDPLRDAISYAAGKGILLICSVGNDGSDALSYPAAYPETIGVGSVDSRQVVSSFSNHNDSVFVVAPGEDVVSLGRSAFGVAVKSGTSYAAPFVTGLAALLKESYPQMGPADFREILKRAALDLGTEGYDPYYGWGLIQADQTLAAAAEYYGG